MKSQPRRIYDAMGKIKSKLVRRTAKKLVEANNSFTGQFEQNKKILHHTIPSMKLRNQIAGLIAKMKKRQKEKETSLKLGE